MTINTKNGLVFAKPADIAHGRVVLTPDGEQPYKVEFRVGSRIVGEHPVGSVREGEALIRSELAEIQFTEHTERPDPEAPKRNGPEEAQ